MDRIGKLIARMKLPGGPSLEDLARAAWPLAAGKIIARHTAVAGLERGSLLVEVEDESWRRQLAPLASQILRNLAAILGPEAISRIQFRLGRLPRPGPARATANTPADEADAIADPVLRQQYRRQRARALG